MSPTRDKPFDARVLVMVPAYNEAGNIRAVLEDLAARAGWADVVVVDDGSTDGTAAIAAGRGVPVLRLPCNVGVGGAVQTGYLYASDKGYDIAVQFDGDGQHRANRIEALVEKVHAGQADLAIGSRLLDGVRFRFHPLRLIGSRLLALVVSTIARQRITDPTSGFRAASRRAIRFFARHYPQSYLGDTAESLVWAARQRMKMVEVPVRMRQRTGGTSATGSVKGFCHTLRIVLAVLVDCLEPRMEEEETAQP